MPAPTPIFTGSVDVLRKLRPTSGQIIRVYSLGDSITTGAILPVARALKSRDLLAGHSFAINGLAKSLVWTIDASTLAGVGMQATLLGGTSSAESTLGNRMFSSAMYPFTPAQEYLTTQQYLGEDFINAHLAVGGTIRATVIVHKHSNGPQNADFRLTISHGATIDGSSAYFNGYAATPTAVAYTVDLPPAKVGQGPFNLNIVMRGDTVSETNKIFRATVAFYERIGDTGVTHVDSGVGGATVESFLDGTSVSTDWWQSLVTYNPELVTIALGQNNPSNNTASQHTTKIVQLANRVRSYCPNTAILFISTHATAASCGGNRGEQYFVPGNADAVAQIPNSAHLNMQKLMPPFEMMNQGFRLEWSDNATGINFPLGSYIKSAGTYYSAKVNHLKGVTAPASDSTNWQPVTTTNPAGGAIMTADYTANIIIADGVHLTYRGNEVKASIGFRAIDGIIDSEDTRLSQLSTDTSAVTAKANKIVEGTTILGVTGTLDAETPFSRNGTIEIYEDTDLDIDLLFKIQGEPADGKVKIWRPTDSRYNPFAFSTISGGKWLEHIQLATGITYHLEFSDHQGKNVQTRTLAL